ncbi:MAG TPA: alpha/beta hydrolase [Gemmataceae bacterium]|nr:alpha/beta hydrolase [Gemmataceae bacterium]
MPVGLLTLSLALAFPSAGPDHLVVPLWEHAPGARGDGPADRPTLTVFLPPADKTTGTAVVVCPGGGYGGLEVHREGNRPAEWLNQLGVAAFVLRYRLAPYRHPVPLQDAQRALRTVRARAAEWHLAPHRIGIWGFSAGGHLASTAATHFDDGKPDAADPVERVSCRPDFAILAYPVITMKAGTTHMGSRNNLLGKDADPKLVEELSNELHVTARTPPTFLFHTDTDTVVPPQNSVLFYLALHRAGVPAEIHIFDHGPHGVDLARNDPALSKWPDLLRGWLEGRGLLKKG